MLTKNKFEIPGLDGIRAFAVISVIIFHGAIYQIMPGGYLGVDLFFTLSGFLITSLILNEIAINNHFNLGNFYVRRLRRLYPAMICMIIISGLYAFFFAPDAIESIKDDFLPSLFYYSNYYQLNNELPYFEQFNRPHAFRHLWSLAVEMHFYLFWPLFFAYLYKTSQKKGFALLGLFLAITLTAWSIYLADKLAVPYDGKPEYIYFRTDCRIADLIFGSYLAFLLTNKSQLCHKRLLHPITKTLGWISLLFLLIAFLNINQYSYWLYRGGFCLISIATCFLIIAASTHGHSLFKVFNAQILAWIGKRSYSLYLWHWPIFTFFRPGEELPNIPLLSFIIRLLITFVVAELSFKFVESPFRLSHGKSNRPITKLVFAISFVAGLFVITKLFSTSNKTISHPLAKTVELVAPLDPKIESDQLPIEETNTISEDKQIKQEYKHPYPLSLTSTRITAIGDSVMLGAYSILQRYLPIVKLDAVVGRQSSNALQVVKLLKSSNQLSEDVLIHIGTNGTIYEKNLKELLSLLSDRRSVVIFNVHGDKVWINENNQLLKKYSVLYPNFRFVDWDNASTNHPDYFVKDGIHLTVNGMYAYSKLAQEAFNVPNIPEQMLIEPQKNTKHKNNSSLRKNKSSTNGQLIKQSEPLPDIDESNNEERENPRTRHEEQIQ